MAKHTSPITFTQDSVAVLVTIKSPSTTKQAQVIRACLSGATAAASLGDKESVQAFRSVFIRATHDWETMMANACQS